VNYKPLDSLLTKIYRIKNGNECELCGAFTDNIGVMHIFGKKAHPELRYHFYNIVWAGWWCCHYHYDNSTKKKWEIIERIKKVRCDDYVERLYSISRQMPKKLDYNLIRDELKSYLDVMEVII